MKRVPSIVWAALIFGTAYAFFGFGIAPLTGRLTGIAAPLPSSLVHLYTGMVALAILLYFSTQEERWEDFIGPFVDFLRDPRPTSRVRKAARRAVLVLVPLLVGGWAFVRDRSGAEPPVDPPGIHFSLPNEYVGIKNPLPWTPENIRQGGILYTKNCAMCHGDASDGEGIFARALQPRPADFRDTGTIAQLDENYLYWRIKKGGPGLPRGSIDYRSAMPVWEGELTDEQIWKIIMFEYTNAGVKPARR